MINEQGFWEEEIVEGADGWTIEDDQQAEWAMKKIVEAQAEFDRWKTYYTEALEKVKARTDNTVSFMTAKLCEYFRVVPHKETKTQEKYSLPSGDLVMKKAKRVWEHEDDAALLQWARDNGFSDCIKTVEKVSWSDVKKRLAENADGVIYDMETGVVCEAVKSVESAPEFVVSTAKA